MTQEAAALRREWVLGVDVGTTSAKVGAFTADGTAGPSAERGYALAAPARGAAVLDADEVVAAALDAVAEVVHAVGAAGGTVVALGCSAAMHGLAGVDADGRPLTPLITWADTRAGAQARRLRAEHPELHARTGTPLHPMAPLAKLAWLREEDPALLAAAARWVGVKELLLARLTGRWVVDHSCASGTGLLALATLDWDDEALALAGVRRDQLCALVPATAVVGGLTAEAAARTGLPADVAVVAGAGDGPLANVGIGAVRPGVAACSIGTSGALRLIVEAPVVDPTGRLFCFALTPRRWVVGGAINNGGVVLRWANEALAPDLGPHGEAALLALAAAVPPGSDGLMMLPSLLSERAPRWDAVPRGAYVGLTLAHGRGHLVRAALEGVCQQLALVLASLREAGLEIHEVRATGGFARSTLWRQMLTDVLGCDVGFARGDAGSGLGAALVALEALGRIDTIERAPEVVRVGSVLQPEPAAAALYAARLPVFAGLAEALAPTFTALDATGPS